MAYKLVFLILLFGIVSQAQFRFTIPVEPKSLDLSSIKSSPGTTLTQLLHRSLTRIQGDKLEWDLAKKCEFLNATTLNCLIRENQFWSNGETISAADFLSTWNYYKLNPAQSEIAEWINNIERLEAQKNTLTFHLKSADPLLIWRLSTSLFPPLYQPDKSKNPFPSLKQAESFISSGFYKIKNYDPGKKIILSPNSHIPEANKRADLHLYFVSDDTTAFHLYEKNEIDFLRRLPAAKYPKYAKTNELIKTPTVRFDYIGFGPYFKDKPELRRAISLSVDFEQWKKVLEASGRPGCPSLPESFFVKVPCLENIKAAELKVRFPKDLLFIYSKQGGEDHQRVMQWLQFQWQKQLGLQVKMSSLDQIVFNQSLKEQRADLFRKGVNLSIPHCAEALQTFITGARENHIQFSNTDYDQLAQKLMESQDPLVKKQLCQKGVELLLQNYALIPLGHIVFNSLLKPSWQGLESNALNQLDLRNLRQIK